ncbi:MAG: hypothetical protein AAF575_00575 [Bacteroidota bacterium]|nr:hypothetical protein [uncultured Allomuricauda sp.]
MKKLLLFILCFTGLLVSAQMECTLGIGGRDNATIIEVFQLNDIQQESLNNWSAELKVRNSHLKNKAKFLLKKHQESPPNVLMEMSHEYRELLDSMRYNSKMMDRRLLGTFNKKQYDLYVELCGLIAMDPLRVNNSVNEK